MDDSQQRTEFLDSEAGIPHDPAHRKRVNRIVPRDRDDSCAVSHDNMLALAGDSKTCLFERSDRRKMIDAWYSRQR